MKLLEKFILGMPYWFLKMLLYAWVGVIFFWSWPPFISGIFMAIVLLGLGMIIWQRRAWEASITREFHSGEARPYVDHPHIARRFQVLNFVLVCIVCGLVGWFLHGLINLSGPQWFLLSAGFMFASRDAIIFGSPVTYIITSQGIGIRCAPRQVDHRLFFKFHEIGRAEHIKVPMQIPQRWQLLTPQRYPKEGVMLYAARAGGFSKQVQGEVLLAPTDIEGFLKELAGHVAVVEEADITPGK